MFPFGTKDDQIDAASLALAKLGWVQSSNDPDYGACMLVPGREKEGERPYPMPLYGPEYGEGGGFP